MRIGLIGGFAALMLLGHDVQAQPSSELRIFAIDVEGGAATLYVTPEGHSLLVDTGWPSGMGGPRGGAPSPSSAERIAAQLKALGLSKLDYLMVSHYHIDHIGGAIELMKLVPIGTFLDHGPNREPPANPAAPLDPTSTAAQYAAYQAAIAGKPHRVLSAGDTLRLDSLTLNVVTSDAKAITKPLPGAGQRGALCDTAVAEQNPGAEENPRSLGVLATFGQARILTMGDATWSAEIRLVCPTNMIGKVDLMWLDNHGSANANNPALLASVRPTVLVSNNGPAKGLEAPTIRVLKSTAGIANLWQVHYMTRLGDAANTTPGQIANIDGGPDAMNPLRITVARTGAVTVSNPRTGASKTYPKVR